MKTLQEMSQSWWLILLRGMTLLALGLVFLVWPAKSIVTVTLFVGLLLIFDGLFVVLSGLLSSRNKDYRWSSVLQGLIAFTLGLAVFNWPKVTLGFLIFVLAAWMLVIGIFTVATAISLRKEMYGNWLVSAMGLFALLLSLVLFTNPAGTVIFLSVIYGVVTLLTGIFTIALSMDLRKINTDHKNI
jgi:uncharacterized membrane protein HdeD (DUF308 family)